MSEKYDFAYLIEEVYKNRKKRNHHADTRIHVLTKNGQKFVSTKVVTNNGHLTYGKPSLVQNHVVGRFKHKLPRVAESKGLI